MPSRTHTARHTNAFDDNMCWQNNIDEGMKVMKSNFSPQSHTVNEHSPTRVNIAPLVRHCEHVLICCVIDHLLDVPDVGVIPNLDAQLALKVIQVLHHDLPTREEFSRVVSHL